MLYRVVLGSNCSDYCQCDTRNTLPDGSVERHWVRQACPTGEIWVPYEHGMAACRPENQATCTGKT